MSPIKIGLSWKGVADELRTDERTLRRIYKSFAAELASEEVSALVDRGLEQDRARDERALCKLLRSSARRLIRRN